MYYKFNTIPLRQINITYYTVAYNIDRTISRV